jgi:ATP-dependent Clp protease ATP-binding subunit ClpC
MMMQESLATALGAEVFARFTERLRRAVDLADDEAERLHHSYVGTEHLLLGLVREGTGVAAVILASLGVDLPRAREAVLFHIRRGDAPPAGSARGLTERARRTLELAATEAGALGHRYIGQEHLLLALARRGDEAPGIVARLILESLGVDVEGLPQRIMTVLAQAGPAPARDRVVTCRVDETTLRALDALVEVGIHTTRSEAAARLIKDGMAANRALLDKVYAAVDEIGRVRAATQDLARQWPPAEQPES